MAKNTQPLSDLQLSLINPRSAAIDVGATMMMISYTDKQGQHHLLEVASFTADLEKAVAILKKAGVTTVAMEATGVYWTVIYELLESAGFAVTLANAKHFKNVDGQKTDVKDSQWLHQLHAHGLIRKSHIPAEIFRELKSYMHERGIAQEQKSDTLNRIHKTLTQMNVKVQHLISDIEGVTGMSLLHGIAEGITDPSKLLALIKLKSLKASPSDLLQSLKGLYKPQYVMILRNQLKAYAFHKQQMRSYETYIEQVLQQLLPVDENGVVPEIAPKKSYIRKNQYGINITTYLRHIIGVDLTEVPGLDEINLLSIISVTGLDLSKWPTEGHFTSWLGLAPDPRISGGRVIGHKRKMMKNKATQAFRLAARTMGSYKGPLGVLYRRLLATKGARKAIKAIARKLAVIFYALVTRKEAYDPTKQEQNTELRQARKLASLKKEAAKYGYTLGKVA